MSGAPAGPRDLAELVAGWGPGDAVLEGDGHGVARVGYARLARMVDEERRRAERRGGRAAGCVVSGPVRDASTLARVLGCVLAGVDVVMADPSARAGLARLGVQDGARLPRSAEDDGGGARLRGPGSEGSEGSETPEGRLVFLTSGTSAEGKPVVLGARALCSAVRAGQAALACGPGDVVLSLLPTTHVFGFVCGLLWPLAFGACAAFGRGLRHLYDDCAFFGPTVLPAVPSLAAALLKAGSLDPGLKTVLLGGAAPDASLVEGLRAAGFGVRVGYGLTETASGVAMSAPSGDPSALRLCAGWQARASSDGGLLVRGPGLMDGYLVPLGAGGLRIDPHVDEAGWFDTGDLGTCAEGVVRVSGRRSDVVVGPDGTKVPAALYEREVARAVGVDEAVVVADAAGHAVLAVGSAVSVDAAERAVRALNARRPPSQRLWGVFGLGHAVPRTRTGKPERWKARKELFGDGDEQGRSS